MIKGLRSMTELKIKDREEKGVSVLEIGGVLDIGSLEVLQKKTKGNLVEEEEKILNGVLYELQMQFVQAVSTQAPPPTEGAVQA